MYVGAPTAMDFYLAPDDRMMLKVSVVSDRGDREINVRFEPQYVPVSIHTQGFGCF
jgi:hypothetical protein